MTRGQNWYVDGVIEWLKFGDRHEKWIGAISMQTDKVNTIAPVLAATYVFHFTGMTET